MRSYEKIYLTLLPAALAFVFGINQVEASKELPSAVNIKIAKPDDSVTIQPAKPKQILVVVKSHSGIGRATINGLNKDGAKTVTLRFWLKGLEGLQVSNGTITLNAAASVRDQELQVRQWKGGEDNAPLDDTDPLSMKVRIASDDGQLQSPPSLPLKKGYFDVVLPKALFSGNPQAITLSWIDFYR